MAGFWDLSGDAALLLGAADALVIERLAAGEGFDRGLGCAGSRPRWWRREPGPGTRSRAPDRRAHRAVARVRAGHVFGVDAAVLAHYAHEFAASKPAIGLLAAAYPAGTVPGSLLGGWIATRAGVRRTTVAGLLLFTAAIAPFGFGSSIAVLGGLRFIQGVASGCIWSAALAWVIAIAPSARRGEVLGSVLASVIFGALVGTILGTLADAIGTEVVFACIGVLALGLTVWTLGFREPPRTSLGGAAPPRALISNRPFMLGLCRSCSSRARSAPPARCFRCAFRNSAPPTWTSASRSCLHRWSACS